MKEESDKIFDFPPRTPEHSSVIVGIGGGASRLKNSSDCNTVYPVVQT